MSKSLRDQVCSAAQPLDHTEVDKLAPLVPHQDTDDLGRKSIGFIPMRCFLF